jgi:hypothetical protein
MSHRHEAASVTPAGKLLKSKISSLHSGFCIIGSIAAILRPASVRTGRIRLPAKIQNIYPVALWGSGVLCLGLPSTPSIFHEKTKFTVQLVILCKITDSESIFLVFTSQFRTTLPVLRDHPNDK